MSKVRYGAPRHKSVKLLVDSLPVGACLVLLDPTTEERHVDLTHPPPSVRRALQPYCVGTWTCARRPSPDPSSDPSSSPGRDASRGYRASGCLDQTGNTGGGGSRSRAVRDLAVAAAIDYCSGRGVCSATGHPPGCTSAGGTSPGTGRGPAITACGRRCGYACPDDATPAIDGDEIATDDTANGGRCHLYLRWLG